MKRIFILFVLVAFVIPILGQTPNQVYLKNGSIIKGRIVELDPSNEVKIETSDGSLFVFPMADIDHIVGAVISDKNTGNNVWSKKDSYRRIDRHGSDFYWEDTDEKLTPAECSSILSKGGISDNLYETYKSAQIQFNNGRSLIVAGVTFTLAAVVSYCLYLNSGSYSYDGNTNGFITTYDKYDTNKLTLFYVSSAAADACLFFGFLFKGIGKGRLEWVKDTYNSGRSQASAIKVAPSLMMTAQNDFGFGLSLNLSF